jgi:hypothetical protein
MPSERSEESHVFVEFLTRRIESYKIITQKA